MSHIFSHPFIRLSILTLLGSLLLVSCHPSDNARTRFEKRIDSLLAASPASLARVGFALLTPDREFILRNDTLLPMLSTFKFPVALAVLDRAQREQVDLHQTTLQVAPERLVPDTYSPMRDSLPASGGEVSLERLLRYTVSESDNIACDLLIDWVGGTDAIDRYVTSLGVSDIHIVATEEQMHQAPENQRLNIARPSAICRLFARFLDGDLLTPAHNTLLHTMLTGTVTGPNKLCAGIPDGVLLGHKTGSSDRTPDGQRIADNDAGYVILPDGRRYCIAVFVTDSRASDRDNASIAAQLSTLAYEYLNTSPGR